MHKMILSRHRDLIRNAAANRIEQYHHTSFNQIKAKLEQRTHLFIVVLGMLIALKNVINGLLARRKATPVMVLPRASMTEL